MRQQISVGRTGRAILLAALVVALAGCGGGGSDEATDTVITTDTTSTDTTSTDTFGETTDTTDTSATSTVDAGETATWRGDTFTVSDVETSDTAPEPDPFGEMAEAENGVWLSFKITPAEDDSGIWSAEFTSNMLIKGGDGVVYDSSSHQSFHNNAGEQNEFDASDFLVWVDIPEAAVSGAVLEINDGLHTVDPDPDNYLAEPVPDPAYATRVNLGL